MELCEKEYEKLKKECINNIVNHYRNDHNNMNKLLKSLKYYLIGKEDSDDDIKLINDYLQSLTNI